MSKLLTVVTSTYNKGDRNRASIQSILDQTHRDFEYIVVNDNSPDNTKEILGEFNDPRLKIIHQENKGFVKTMVSVMSQIQTPYVAIQGAGDISLPERFEKQLQYLETRPEVGVVACRTASITVSKSLYQNDIDKIVRAKHRQARSMEYNSVEQMIRSNIVNHGEAMIRMSAYHEAGGYRSFFRFCQDRDLWLRVLENYSVVRLGDLLYIKVVDPKLDITGNPKKAEKQALYSLFARHLANQRLLTNRDPLEENGEEAFQDFVSLMSDSSKGEVAKGVLHNTLRSRLDREAIETGYSIIQKYVPVDHKVSNIFRLLMLMEKTMPSSVELYRFYYFQIERNFLLSKRRVSTIPSKLSELMKRIGLVS